ncbi:Acetyltransferase [Frankia canadensis]|uniref:Acetyltransferase n=1 Tax=Frankia canadensis TaxID=1836972 RepID=A0A2I2KIG7_9ACTN|nr:GNAT family N-acetyltransferase [Frankia canadensis]SNQ45465.1 Acetyltransferase [Frankia canadensis]SOU52755.1 Acetyltransferase [Frankia canadensis]
MIRVAGPGDVEDVLALVRQLAAYESEPGAVAMTAADLQAALFAPMPSAHCLVATPDPLSAPDQATAQGVVPPPVVGFAIWHPTFSTWTGQTGMHLIDLFVRAEHRRAGHGRGLLAALAAIAVEHGHRRLEWAVLDWNTPAHGFYRSLAAHPLDGWTTWRLDGDALTALAAQASPCPGISLFPHTQHTEDPPTAGPPAAPA